MNQRVSSNTFINRRSPKWMNLKPKNCKLLLTSWMSRNRSTRWRNSHQVLNLMLSEDYNLEAKIWSRILKPWWIRSMLKVLSLRWRISRRPGTPRWVSWATCTMPLMTSTRTSSSINNVITSFYHSDLKKHELEVFKYNMQDYKAYDPIKAVQERILKSR